jgi:hypothetical protein
VTHLLPPGAAAGPSWPRTAAGTPPPWPSPRWLHGAEGMGGSTGNLGDASQRCYTFQGTPPPWPSLCCCSLHGGVRAGGFHGEFQGRYRFQRTREETRNRASQARYPPSPKTKAPNLVPLSCSLPCLVRIFPCSSMSVPLAAAAHVLSAFAPLPLTLHVPFPAGPFAWPSPLLLLPISALFLVCSPFPLSLSRLPCCHFAFFTKYQTVVCFSIAPKKFQ